MSTFRTLLVEGFAQYLADSDIGLSWDMDGLYQPGQRGIYLETIPATPDQIVTLAVTFLVADPTLADSPFNLQIRTRGTKNPRDAYATDDAIQDQLLGRYPLTLPTGVVVSKLHLASSGPLAPDENQRTQLSANWQGVAYRPGPYRR